MSRGLTNRQSMRMGIYKQILTAPTTRQFEYASGGDPLMLSLGKDSSYANDGVTMLAGGIEIDNLTFANIRRVRVKVIADNRMPFEQEAQLGSNLAQVKTATGMPLYAVEDIRERFFHDPNPWLTQRNALLEMQAADPKSPWGQTQVIRAMIDKAREILGPESVVSFEQQYEQMLPVAIQSAIMQAITAMQQAATMPPQGQLGPGGPGGPPGGGPPQLGPGGNPPGPPPGMGPGGPPPGPPPGMPPGMPSDMGPMGPNGMGPPNGLGGMPMPPPPMGGPGPPSFFPGAPPPQAPPMGLGTPGLPPTGPQFMQQPMLAAGPPGMPM